MIKTNIGSIIEFQRGYDLTHEQMAGGPYPVVGSTSTIGFHDQYKAENCIVIGRSGSVGQPQYISGKFWPHNTTLFTTDLKGNNVRYLYYLLCNLNIGKMKTGSNIPTLNRNDLYPLIIPFEENICIQNDISNILATLDAKIDNNNEIISELESMAKDIYNYWFVQFDFPDENGKPYKSSGGKMVWNEQLKREIPEGWKVGTFSDVISNLESGDRPSGGALKDGVPSIGAENIIGIGRYDFSNEKYVSKEYFESMRSGVIHSWDVLIYKDGAGVGQCSMFGDGFPYEKCAINSHVFIIRSNGNIFQDYLYLTLKQPYMKKILVSLALKAAQPGLNQPAIQSLPVIIPSEQVLQLFNSFCDTVFHKIFACAKENRELTSLRDWLLPMLMNGQVKVR